MTDDRKRKTGGEVELLPLPWSDVQPNGRRWLFKLEDRPRVEDYTRANVERALAESRESLARVRRLPAEDATALDAKRRQAEARAERLAEALRDLLEALGSLSATVDAAITAGDWKVDGACDPDIDTLRARAAIAKATQIEGDT